MVFQWMNELMNFEHKIVMLPYNPFNVNRSTRTRNVEKKIVPAAKQQLYIRFMNILVTYGLDNTSYHEINDATKYLLMNFLNYLLSEGCHCRGY